MGTVVSDLGFLGWEVAEGGVQSLGVVPADPLGDCPFDLISVAPGGRGARSARL